MNSEVHPTRLKLAWRAIKHHALSEHDHTVQVVGDRAELMAYQQYCSVVLVHKVHQRVSKLCLRFGIDSRHRLVEHQQQWVRSEGLCDKRPLQLPARERPHLRAPMFRKAYRSDCVLHRLSVARAHRAPERSGCETPSAHEFFHGHDEVFGNRWALGYVPNPGGSP